MGMGSFGGGLASGFVGGMGIGQKFKDAFAEDDINKASRARVKEDVQTQEQLSGGDAPSDGVAPGWADGAVDPSIYGTPTNGPDAEREAYAKEFGEAVVPVKADGVESDSTPYVDPVGTRASTSKKTWTLGEGEHKKTFDVEPTAAEVRQWKFDTIQKTAGDKYADEWEKRELNRDSLNRRAEGETIKLAQDKRGEADSLELRGNDTTGSDNLAEAIKANGGTADSYIAATEGGITPLTTEQRKTINKAAGIALDPTTKYYAQMRQAGVLRRSDPAKAIELEKAATKQAAGQFISALEQGDTAAVKSLYNLFPNGHLVSSVRFVGDNVVAKGRDGKEITKTKRELMIMAQAYADPDKAMNTMSGDERMALQAQRHSDELRIKEERLKLAQEKQAGGGGGGDMRKDAAAIFSEAQKIVTGEDGKTDGERLGPINAMAQNLYRSGQATSPGEAVMLAKDRLANAEFSPNRAIARAQQDFEQIKKTQNVTGALNPTGNSWADVSKQITGKSVSEEQFVKDLAQRYIDNGKGAPAPAQAPQQSGQRYAEGAKLRGKDGVAYVVRNGEPVPLAQTAGIPTVPKAAAPAPQPATQPPAGHGTSESTRSFNDRKEDMLKRIKEASADPDIAALEPARLAAIKAGKPYVANNIAAKQNEIKRERYGI